MKSKFSYLLFELQSVTRSLIGKSTMTVLVPDEEALGDFVAYVVQDIPENLVAGRQRACGAGDATVEEDKFDANATV